MEQIINNLLTSDNDIRNQATTDLQEAFNHPESIPSLCDIVVTSQKPQIRQYAAVLLRKRLGKLRNWQKVQADQQEIIKRGMLNAVMAEQEKSVRNAIAQFIGILIKHEFAKKDLWTQDVLKMIYETCSSNNSQQSEIGSSIFTILTDIAPDQFVEYINSICEMFMAAFMVSEANGTWTSPVLYNIVQGMSNLSQFILGQNMAENTYQKSIPYIVQTLKSYAKEQLIEQFIKTFDFLDNITEYTPKLLTGHLKLLIDFCLEISTNLQMDDSIRVRCIAFIGYIIRIKKKSILKLKMIDVIIHALFTIMAMEPPRSDEDGGDDDDDDEDDEYYHGGDSTKPSTAATQTLDLLAIHLPPEKIIPPLLSLLEPALKSNDPLHKKAAYLCMAVVAEGCGDAICTKYLPTLLDCIKLGIIDGNLHVRNAAFFALGQFSEHLQPDITKYAHDILPILFSFLQQISNQLQNGQREPKNIERMFYALETFCENLSEETILPHLPMLMERLFESLNPKNSVRLRELAFSAVSSAANAGKELMLPYFERIVEILKMYLINTDDKDICKLRPQAVDTLAAIARTIGKTNFSPLTESSIQFALMFIDTVDDPDLSSSIYNLCAALSEVMNENMQPVLPRIIERMLDTINSSEEVVTEFKDNNGIGKIYDGGDGKQENDDELGDDIDIEDSINEDDGDDDDDDDDGIAGYSVENAYLDQKEEAILAVKQIAENTGLAFASFIQPCFEAVYKQIDHPQDDIRKSSIETLTALIVSLQNTNDVQAVRNTISIIVPKFSDIIKTDEECQVVISALESFGDLLKKCKENVVFDQSLQILIFECIQDVLNSKVVCQYEENIEENEESEYDEAIIEMAGDVLPRFGEALQPDDFAVYFERICPLLIGKIEKTKDDDDLASQRSFSYGTISECFRPLKHNTMKWYDILLPIYLYGLQDKNESVRHNSVYGLGELVLHSGQISYKDFPQILQLLSVAVAHEKHEGTLDNICGALARLILTNYLIIPLDQVLPVFVQKLPLRVDYDENTSIFKCFKFLFDESCAALLQVLDNIIFLGLTVLLQNEYKDEDVRNIIIGLIKDIRIKFPDRINAIATSNPDLAYFMEQNIN